MSFIELLSKEISDLPGEKAHKKFYPYRFEFYEKPLNTKLSAVGIHLFQMNSEWYFILIERSEYIGYHSKQIAFPGGKKDPEDINLEHTARRESYEEISISMDSAFLIGQITPVYIPASNFEVFPFIFFHKDLSKLCKSEKEVNEIIFVKCSDLVNDQNISITEVNEAENIKLKQIPCFILNEKVVWGATALILSEVREILLRIKPYL